MIKGNILTLYILPLMSTSNVVNTTNMAGVGARPWREQWRFYKRCHPLATEYPAARHGHYGPIMNFVQQCLMPGSVAVIDSFAPAVALIHPVARWVELDSFETVTRPWSPEIANTIFPDYWGKYTTVVMLGEQWAKYRTPEQFAQLAGNYQEWLQPTGRLIICMPVTHMIYHRLKFGPDQVLQQVNEYLPKNFKIKRHQQHQLNIYLEIELCQ
jgi:hypothetical protein